MGGVRGLRLFVTGVVIIFAGLGLATAGALSANISRSYQADSKITEGSMVSLDPSRSDYVVPANVNNGSRLLGVAVASGDSLVAFNSSRGTVQVATSGDASVLVSTLNGDISVGDQVAVSPFNGVGMKALRGSRIIGLAQTSFSGDGQGATTTQATDKKGKTTSLKVGLARVSIAIGTNANVLSDADLNSLQKFARSLTGHTVSTARIVISLAVAVVAILTLTTLVYASIYGSVISIGRNPLAKYAVFRTLGSVIGLAALITVVAGLIIFFLLR